VLLIVEGDVDRAVVEALQARGLLPVLPIAPQKGEKPQGRDAQPNRLRALVRSSNPPPDRIAVLRDYDDARRDANLATALAEALRLQTTGSTDTVTHHAGATSLSYASQGVTTPVDVLGVGLHADSDLAEYGVTRPSMDDYLVKLVLHTDAELGSVLKATDRGRVRHKVLEVCRLMGGQGFAVSEAKRVLSVFKAVAGFRATDATLASESIAHAPVPVVGSVFMPLVDQLKQLLP
jgi:hypothetical protein